MTDKLITGTVAASTIPAWGSSFYDPVRDELNIASTDSITLDPAADATITSTGNIVNRGAFRMRGSTPGTSLSPAVKHTVQFLGVDETKVSGAEPKPIASVSVVGTTATVTFSPYPTGITSHNLTVGDPIDIIGVLDTAYNGSARPITAVLSSTQIQYTTTGTPAGSSTGGTVTAKAPTRNDIGLWTIGAGVLDLLGAPKQSWTESTADIPLGATTVPLRDAPTGWRAGDLVTIPPMGVAQVLQWDELTVQSVNVGAKTVTFTSPTVFAHNRVTHAPTGRTFSPELLNLTRNIQIKGEVGHRIHVFTRNTTPAAQTIKYGELQLSGPRSLNGVANQSVKITGRWGWHFHDSGDNSRGTYQEGCVAHDAGSHAFVPHMSHGITQQDCISYNTLEGGFWWDGTDLTNAVVWRNCVVGRQGFGPNNDGSSASGGSGGSAAFKMGPQLEPPAPGDEIDAAIGCRAIGVRGGQSAGTASGYAWDNDLTSGRWLVQDCLSHNNNCLGLFYWVNSTRNDRITSFVAFHCGVGGMIHGAYTNDASIDSILLFENGNPTTPPNDRGELIVKANSSTIKPDHRSTFSAMVLDGGGLYYPLLFLEHQLPAVSNTLFWDTVLLNPLGSQYIFVKEAGVAPMYRDLIRPQIGNTGRDLIQADVNMVALKAGLNSVSAASWAAGVATVVLGTSAIAAHYQVGDRIQVTLANPSGYNATTLVTAVNSGAKTVSYAVASNPGAYVSGAKITDPTLGSRIRWQSQDGTTAAQWTTQDGVTIDFTSIAPFWPQPTPSPTRCAAKASASAVVVPSHFATGTTRAAASASAGATVTPHQSATARCSARASASAVVTVGVGAALSANTTDVSQNEFQLRRSPTGRELKAGTYLRDFVKLVIPFELHQGKALSGLRDGYSYLHAGDNVFDPRFRLRQGKAQSALRGGANLRFSIRTVPAEGTTRAAATAHGVASPAKVATGTTRAAASASASGLLVVIYATGTTRAAARAGGGKFALDTASSSARAAASAMARLKELHLAASMFAQAEYERLIASVTAGT